MKNIFALILSHLFVFPVIGQEIYLSTFDDIWRFDPDNCTMEFIIYCDEPLFDISFHPDGTLFGVNGGGDLFSINLINGSTAFIHEFEEVGFTSLTIGADGIMYLMGIYGNIWTYDINTDIGINLGPTGFWATGDLTFYNGGLYVATSESRIVKIDLENPLASYVVVDDQIPGDIIGIVSDYVSCHEVNCYATTSGEKSEVYKIDFENNSYELICELHHTITGGASTAEFLASVPISVGNMIGVNPSCNDENGEISIPSGVGYGQLEYSINGGSFQVDSLFKKLKAGFYSICIRDEIGCIDSSSITLDLTNAPGIDNIIIQPAACGEENGSLLIIASNGVPPFLYSLNNNVSQPGGLFENLAPGKYILTVLDAAGCTTQDSAVIPSNSLASITSVDIQNTSCGELNGSLTIHVNEPEGIRYSIDGINFQSDPYFGNLSAQLYTVVIIDSNSCTDTSSINIIENELPQFEIINVVPAHCSMKDGAFTLNAYGGIPPYHFSLDDIMYFETNEFNGLAPGPYVIYIMDAEGCTTSMPLEIGQLDGPHIINVKSTPSECGKKNGSIQIEIEGGVMPIQIALNNEFTQTETLFSQLMPGEHSISLVDAAGCTNDTIISISQTGCPVYIPNVFSPNGDGVNDLFKLHTADESSLIIKRFLIFDRWGNNVFNKTDLPVDSPIGWWDGTLKKWTLSAGNYAYFIEVEFDNGERATYKGDVTLIR